VAGRLLRHHGGDQQDARLVLRSRPAYGDVVADVTRYVTAEADRAVAAGVRRDAILIDPAHDFGKNTWHSLELTRRFGELAGTGWPVLAAVSHKDFVGETLGLPLEHRAAGTVAAATICAWQGARVLRVHDVPAARRALQAVRWARGGVTGRVTNGRRHR